jgi:hypothetical protein
MFNCSRTHLQEDKRSMHRKLYIIFIRIHLSFIVVYLL